MKTYWVQCKRREGWVDYLLAGRDRAIATATDYETKRSRGLHWRCVMREDIVLWPHEEDQGEGVA